MMKINIKRFDDLKGKSQSHELKVDIDINKNDEDTYGNFDFVTYGCDKEETNKNAKIFIDKLISRLEEVKNKLD